MLGEESGCAVLNLGVLLGIDNIWMAQSDFLRSRVTSMVVKTISPCKHGTGEALTAVSCRKSWLTYKTMRASMCQCGECYAQKATALCTEALPALHPHRHMDR